MLIDVASKKRNMQEIDSDKVQEERDGDLRREAKNFTKMKVSLNGSCLVHSECQPKYVQTANHYARHDLAAIKHDLNVMIKNVYCTKISSKIARTYSQGHGYKDLCKELLNDSWGYELRDYERY